MLGYLLDTDHLTYLERGRPNLHARVLAAAGAVGISAVTVEEALKGRLSHIARARDGVARVERYRYLLGTVELLNDYPLVPFDSAAEQEFQRLIGLRTRVGVQDLKIAAVALANGLTVLTRNHRDFARVPGLPIDDWSV